MVRYHQVYPFTLKGNVDNIENADQFFGPAQSDLLWYTNNQFISKCAHMLIKGDWYTFKEDKCVKIVFASSEMGSTL